MDELVVKYYREMSRTGFRNAGSLGNPSIFLDSVGEKIQVCAHVSNAFIHIYINVSDGIIEDAKYLCTCRPTANVAVEILCSLIKGKTIKEAEALTVESFSQVLVSKEEEYLKSCKAVIDLLHTGFHRYKSGISGKK